MCQGKNIISCTPYVVLKRQQQELFATFLLLTAFILLQIIAFNLKPTNAALTKQFNLLV